MKLTTTTFVSVDGVMQGSARRTRTAAADCVDTGSMPSVLVTAASLDRA
jgi:hypothetical protein